MRRIRKKYLIIFIVLLLFITIGYSTLETNTGISGQTIIDYNRVLVKWNNLTITIGSATPEIEPVLEDEETQINFSVKLDDRGEFYEFSFDAINMIEQNTMIDSIEFYVDGQDINSNLPTALEYELTYSDGTPVREKDILKPGENNKESIKVRINTKSTASYSDIWRLPKLSYRLKINYIEADDTARTVYHPGVFSEDSWETIVGVVQSGNKKAYNVGDTKTVNLGSLGNHNLRIANKSTPSACNDNSFSQSACGFVLEFEDIIELKRINPWEMGKKTNGNGNIGGWYYSEARTYINSNIYNLLPIELRQGIIDTYVVSSHGDTTGEENGVSVDKLYLLSTKEIWGVQVSNSTHTTILDKDTAFNNTRQLDYYSGLGVTETKYTGVAKTYSGTKKYYWTRSAYSTNTTSFFYVGYDGGVMYGSSSSSSQDGISPAFRIG